jgi:hypothetical protein
MLQRDAREAHTRSQPPWPELSGRRKLAPVARSLAPLLAAFSVPLLAAAPVWAASGRVADREGRPIADARACIQVEKADGVCSTTDAGGWYKLPDTTLPAVRISAPGFLPRSVAAVDQEGVIVLEAAASLRARLLDATTGEPIADGTLRLASSTGRQIGPFPVNAKGLHVATLVPGRVVATGKADGYRDAVGEEVALVGGEETEIVLRLVRVDVRPDAP